MCVFIVGTGVLDGPFTEVLQPIIVCGTDRRGRRSLRVCGNRLLTDKSQFIFPLPQDHLCGFVSQYPFTTQSPYPDSVPKPQKQKPPRKVRACADARGERSKMSDRGEAILPQKQNCPIPLWKSREKPFSQERFLGLLSFGTFPLQKQRKVHKNNRFS